MFTIIGCISNKIACIKDFYCCNKNKPNIIILTKINAKNLIYPIIDTELNIPGYITCFIKIYHKKVIEDYLCI